MMKFSPVVAKLKLMLMAALVATGLIGASVEAAFAQAQPENPDGPKVIQRIEALVNDDIISGYDLDQRLRFVILTTGGVSSDEEFMRMRSQVLKTMADELLQLQEAAEFEIEIGDDEIKDAFARMAQGMNMTAEQFANILAENGSNADTVYHQIRAEYAWQTIVNGRLGAQVTISDEEVDQHIKRMYANKGKYEYRISEIYLIVDNPQRDARVRSTADRFVEQLRTQQRFEAVARQFSESATAASGGDLGWLSEDQMSPEMLAAVKDLDIKGISNPVRSAGGYYILQLTDRRRILDLDPLDTLLQLEQVYWRFDENTDDDMIKAWMKKAEKEKSNFIGCGQAKAYGEVMNATRAGDLGEHALRIFPVGLQKKLTDLEIGEPSEPIISPDGANIFYVCGTRQPEIQEPDADQVYNQIQQQRLAMMARRYLRDIRRDAIVEYK